MALTTDQIYLLNRMCPSAEKAAIGTAISELQSGTALPYGLVGAMAATGVAAANAVGTATTPARVDHVHKMTPASVITALATAATDIAINAQKITGLANGAANQDAVTKLQLDNVAAAGINVVHVTHTITLANMQAVAGGVKFLTRSTVLPANARIIGALYTFTNVDNAGNTAVASIVSGGTTANGVLNIADASTGGGVAQATKVLCAGSQSAIPWLSFSAQTIATTVTTDVDLNTVTKGAVEVDIFYVVVV